jgi:hypothetical protein
VRVTDRNKDITAGDTSKGLKNEYSRVQSFNANGKFFLIRSISATWYLYRSLDLKPVKKLPFEGSVDPRWDAKNPNVLYYMQGTQMKSCNIQTNSVKVVHDFKRDLPGMDLAAVWTRYEGSPSQDGRYWGLMAENNDWETVAFLIYDLKKNRVIAKRTSNVPPDLDTVTISPRGKYFLAYCNNYCEEGRPGDDTHPCGLMVYDDQLKNGRSLLRIIGHSDTALDSSGQDVLVYQDIDTDWISMLNLESGKITKLIPIDFSHTAIGMHISGRAFKRPGWVVLSTYNGGYSKDFTWLDDQVFAVELKEGGKVVRLAHHHSLYNENEEQDYWAEPHATANPDFSRVLFTSNWGRTGTEGVDTYMIRLPQDWIERYQ